MCTLGQRNASGGRKTEVNHSRYEFLAIFEFLFSFPTIFGHNFALCTAISWTKMLNHASRVSGMYPESIAGVKQSEILQEEKKNNKNKQKKNNKQKKKNQFEQNRENAQLMSPFASR
jgi:hypothetical protein